MMGDEGGGGWANLAPPPPPLLEKTFLKKPRLIRVNPDLNKQAQEVIFSRNLKKVCHPPITMFLRHHYKNI